MKLYPLKADLWKRGDIFDLLGHIIMNISDSHSIHDIITAVAN